MSTLFALDTTVPKSPDIHVALRPYTNGDVCYHTFAWWDIAQLLFLRQRYASHQLIVDKSSVQYAEKPVAVMTADPTVFTQYYRLSGPTVPAPYFNTMINHVADIWASVIAKQYVVRNLVTEFTPLVGKAFATCMQSTLLEFFLCQYSTVSWEYDMHYQEHLFTTMMDASSLYLYKLIQQEATTFKKMW